MAVALGTLKTNRYICSSLAIPYQYTYFNSRLATNPIVLHCQFDCYKKISEDALTLVTIGFVLISLPRRERDANTLRI